jgi:spermidine synthase
MSDPSAPPSRVLTLALAAGAGAGSLAVELVWMRQLSLAFGSASFAAGAVVAAIMLGMAIGSAASARIQTRSIRVDRSLGFSLLLLAVWATCSPGIFLGVGGYGTAGLFLAGAFMIAASIPMGTIVPLLVLWSGGGSAKTAGLIYAVNTLGSAVAILLTGFVLLPKLGNAQTLWTAAAALAVLAAVTFSRKRIAPAEPAAPAPSPSPSLSSRDVAILVAYTASAFAAMASEIGWIRSLILSIGSSTYAYTLVLGVYVAGLGIGSAISSRWLASTSKPARAFGLLQFAIALSCIAAIWLLGRLPALFGRFFAGHITSLGSFAVAALVASLLALLVPTVLIGACFPVTLGWLGARVSQPRASGLLLAAATGGSMLGALLASFVSIPRVGTENTLLAALVIHLLTGSLVATFSSAGRRIWPMVATAGVLGLLVLRPSWDARVLQSGPYVYGSEIARGKKLFSRDDAVASVAVFELPDGNRVLRIDGKTDASLSGIDLVTQLLTAHIPLALHPKPERVALVGLGSGMTLASCLTHSPQQVDCIEISPAVVRASRFFDAETGKPLDDRRVKLHIGDARAVLKRSQEQFDVILNEPSNLWIAGMAGLFTREFYDTCRARLREGGLMGQWIHAYGITEDAFRDAVATFLESFPHATLWELWVSGDYLLVGSTRPYEITLDGLQRRLGEIDVARDLQRIGVTTPGNLLGDLIARENDLATMRLHARIQTDDGLHIEFSAPLGFYGRTRLPALAVLPPVRRESLGSMIRGIKVEWAEARALLREAIRKISEDAPPPESLKPLLEAIRKFPEERQARLLLDDQSEFAIREAQRAVKGGQPAKAMELLEAVPAESRWYADARLRRIALLKRGSAPPHQLAEEYQRVLTVAPASEDAAAGYAETLLALQASEEADETATRALELHPDSPRLHLIRGRALAAQSKPQEAAAEWNETLKLDPKGPWGREADRLLKEKKP